jgi:hypothetical protein
LTDHHIYYATHTLVGTGYHVTEDPSTAGEKKIGIRVPRLKDVTDLLYTLNPGFEIASMRHDSRVDRWIILMEEAQPESCVKKR